MWAQKEFEAFCGYMAAELRIAVSVIVGAWLGVFLVIGLADHHILAFFRSGYTMIAVSLLYFGYRKWKWWHRKKEISQNYLTRVQLRQIEDKYGDWANQTRSD